MYFTIHTPLYPYEVMMQGIPNFLPRGHGTYIYRREIVQATQTDCQYCLYYHGGKCSLEECPFLELKIANGTATIRQVMTSVFSAVTYPPFVGRLKRYIRESENKIMNYWCTQSKLKEELCSTQLSNTKTIPSSWNSRAGE